MTVWVASMASSYKQAFELHTLHPYVHGSFGYYDYQNRTIVARLDTAGAGTIAHEVAHSLIGERGDFPLAPAWVDEGVSSLFELPDFSRPGEIHGRPHFRLQTLRDSLHSKDPGVAARVSLGRLFSLTHGYDFYLDEDFPLNAACAREFVRWLDGQGKLWPWYRAFRDSVLEELFHQDAGDVVQEFTLALLEGEELQFPRIRGAALPWMKRTVRRFAAIHLRKRTRDLGDAG